MASALTILVFIALGLAGSVVVVLGVIYLVFPIFKGVGWLFTHIFRFIFGTIGDTLRAIGAVITSIFLIPLTVGSIAIGRWSATSHYGRAIKGEVATLGRCLYRVFVGHPCRLFGLTALTEGLDKRLPEVMAAAPGADAPKGRVSQFEGYTVVGSLPGGGSGGKLYVAEPTPAKLAALARQGFVDVYQVVIKSFSTHEGSSLPQIVRESRALTAARRLGLILEHALSEERFYYVMRYVPGEPLGLVTQRLHSLGGGRGLETRELRQALAHAIDLLRTLRHYHEGGLWHKDVKPDNIIIHDGRAHLVDFGLVTSLRSSMTLTTHGTEYFRDPEMVRMALKGVKVHEVDGAKFDLYAAGAVIYSVIENSFPAHGGLSQITKNCPEALRWIVRRAMADYDKRYDSAAAMLADLEALAAAADPFVLKPVSLPSMGGAESTAHGEPREAQEAPEFDEDVASIGAGTFRRSPVPPPAPAPAPSDHYGSSRPAARGAPRLTVVNWWTGAYKVDGDVAPSTRPAPVPPPRPAVAARTRDPRLRIGGRPVGVRPVGLIASEQVARARARAAQARARAHARMHTRRAGTRHAAGMNFGAGLAVLVFLAAIAAAGFVYIKKAPTPRASALAETGADVTGFDNGGEAPSQQYAARLADDDGAFTVVAVATPAMAGARSAARPETDPPRIVVLHDRFRADEPAEERARRQIDALAGHFDIITGDDETEIDTLGALRSAIALNPFGAGEAARAVRDWLDQRPDIALVAWIDRDTDGQPATWLLGRRGLSETIVEDAYQAVADVDWAERTN
jgi:serine/threonine protein kinase